VLKHLQNIRYGDQSTKSRAVRPTKKQKLPAGASYTCTSAGDKEQFEISLPYQEEEEEDDDDEEQDSRRARGRKRSRSQSSNKSDSSCYSSISAQVDEIINRIPVPDGNSDKEDEEEQDQPEEDTGNSGDKTCYSVGSYVVAIYQVKMVKIRNAVFQLPVPYRYRFISVPVPVLYIPVPVQ